MKRIELRDINFDKLKKINCKCHLEANLYHDNRKTYKIYKNASKYILVKKERKIELLHDGIELPHVVLPIEKLDKNSSFKGYTMKYISGSIPLYDIKKRNSDRKLLLQIISIISKSLQTIHSDPRKIMVGDLNFNNIILDREFNPHFIDFDSCKIDYLENETIPIILGAYLENRGIYLFETNKNSDRLSLLLSTLDAIFEKNIDLITMYEYDKRAEHIKTLKNMRNLVLQLKKTRKLPTVPYMHEIIVQSDIYSKKRR